MISHRPNTKDRKVLLNHFLQSVLIALFLSSQLDTYSQCTHELDPEFKAEIVARSSGNDLDQPLLQGEEVFIKVGYISHPDSNNRIVHGVVPTFGLGWNLNHTDFNSFYSIYAYHPSTWISSLNDCPPFIKREIPSLCIYEDINGNLQLCNLECEICPCTEGLGDDDFLPSGWFWPFQPSDCIDPGNYPLEQSWGPWGPNANVGNISFKLDILLTVDNFTNIDSCEKKRSKNWISRDFR